MIYAPTKKTAKSGLVVDCLEQVQNGGGNRVGCLEVGNFPFRRQVEIDSSPQGALNEECDAALYTMILIPCFPKSRFHRKISFSGKDR